MLQSDLCDHSDAYIAVKGKIIVKADINRDRLNRSLGKIIVKADVNRDRLNRSLVFKNNAQFISFISKINNVLIDKAEDLDIAIPMYNLSEHSKNYRKTTGNLWNYYRDKPNNPPADNYNADPITNSAPFQYKSSITGKTLVTDENDDDNNVTIKDVEIVVPLKYLSNFWRTLNIPLIKCEIKSVF